MESAKKWLYSLIGKVPPAGKNGPVQNNSAANMREPQEDSVANDIKMFKDFSGKTIGKITSMLSPYAKKGSATLNDTTRVVSSSVDKKFIKILIRGFLVAVFLTVLVFTAVYLSKRIKNEGVGGNPAEGSAVTPVPYVPYKSSVYADDPEVLKLEEDINILGKELNSANIKEDGINPPQLDYDISF